MSVKTALDSLRAEAPLVHCITNYVAMSIAANVVLAAGGSPAMVHAEDEVGEFVPMAGALTINIGTLSPPWERAMLAAARAANAAGKPWVLDPVAHFITAYRRGVTAALVAETPTILRGNASEILMLAGETGAGKGVDAGDPVEAAEAAARALAAKGSVVAVSGEVDYVTDGAREVRVAGGSALMPKVTALGCSLTALMGAYAAVVEPFDAAVAGLAHFAAAGSAAEVEAKGPGSFQVAFLDALANVTPSAVEATVQ